jgi:hypothetical protein
MASRYSVHLQPDQHRYRVWDNKNHGVATSSDGRQCADLHLDDAFKMADRLNAENVQPKDG